MSGYGRTRGDSKGGGYRGGGGGGGRGGGYGRGGGGGGYGRGGGGGGGGYSGGGGGGGYGGGGGGGGGYSGGGGNDYQFKSKFDSIGDGETDADEHPAVEKIDVRHVHAVSLVASSTCAMLFCFIFLFVALLLACPIGRAKQECALGYRQGWCSAGVHACVSFETASTVATVQGLWPTGQLCISVHM